MSEEAPIDMATESLTAFPPAGIVTELAPPKVTAWSVPATVAVLDGDVAWATWQSEIVNGTVPNAFEICTRADVPLMLVWTIWRRVMLLNAVDIDPAIGEAAQVPVHVWAGAWDAKQDSINIDKVAW